MTNKTKGFIYGAIAAASYGMNPLFLHFRSMQPE